MTLVLQPTDQVEVYGMNSVRIWRGHDDRGVEVIAAIAFIGVPGEQDQSRFRAALIEIAPPDCAPRMPEPMNRKPEGGEK